MSEIPSIPATKEVETLVSLVNDRLRRIASGLETVQTQTSEVTDSSVVTIDGVLVSY